MAPHVAREHLLRAILDSFEDGLLSVSLDGTIQSWSSGAQKLYGYSAQEIVGQPMSRLVPLYELEALETLLSTAGEANFRCCEHAERLHKDGSRILLRVTRVLIRDEEGELRGILERGRVISLVGMESHEEAPLRSLVEQIPLLLWTTDQNLRITSNWGTTAPHSMIRPGDLVGRNVCEFLECADRHATPIAEHCETLRGISSHFEYHWKNRVLEIRLEPLRAASGEIIGCLGVGADISDRKKSEGQAFYQARHDALTGLANYREFMERLEQEVRRAERSQQSFTLLLLDLDDLKRINDRHGHLAGNRALKRLAAVMKEHCRSTDLAARYGGDEFAVILIDSDQGMAKQVAHRIEMGLKTDPEEPSLSASIGIGIYPDDGRTSAELIEAADQQLYRRKKEPTGRSVPAPGKGFSKASR